jgi:hypothetical protein
MKGLMRYDTGMTLELSDKYESLDRSFKEKVPKTHYDIINLMELYENYKKNPISEEMRK